MSEKMNENLRNWKILRNFAARIDEFNNKIIYNNEKNISAAQSPPREQARFP